MYKTSRSSLLLACLLVGFALPAQSYDTLPEDYKICTGTGGKASNADTVAACTRLIDNSKKKNELVGFFHAIRSSLSNNKKQNCSDARTASKLLKDPKLQANLRQIIRENCK